MNPRSLHIIRSWWSSTHGLLYLLQLNGELLHAPGEELLIEPAAGVGAVFTAVYNFKRRVW